MKVRRIVAGILISAVGAGVLSGCGKEPAPPPRRSLSPEAEIRLLIGGKIARSTGSHFSMVTSASAEETRGRFVTVLEGQGIFDFKRGEAAMDLRSAESNYLFDMKFVFDETGIYWFAPSFLDRELPPGKEWIKIGASALRKATGGAFDVDSYLRGDPGQDLKFLLPFATSVRHVDNELVRRVRARHYKMTVDMKKMRSALGEGTSELSELSRTFYEGLLEQLGGAKPMDVDVWIDSEGRVVRETVEIERRISTKEGKVEATLRQTYDWFGYDASITVTPPPASVTVDISELGKG